MISLLELFSEKELKTLYHVTTSETAQEIENRGFNPKNVIDYKYYSQLGKDGIYFYDNLRQSQTYAYFLKSKNPNKSLSLITVKVPETSISKSNKIEDGVFVSTDKLNDVKIISIKPINKIGSMY